MVAVVAIVEAVVELALGDVVVLRGTVVDVCPVVLVVELVVLVVQWPGGFVVERSCWSPVLPRPPAHGFGGRVVAVVSHRFRGVRVGVVASPGLVVVGGHCLGWVVDVVVVVVVVVVAQGCGRFVGAVVDPWPGRVVGVHPLCRCVVVVAHALGRVLVGPPCAGLVVVAKQSCGRVVDVVFRSGCVVVVQRSRFVDVDGAPPCPGGVVGVHRWPGWLVLDVGALDVVVPWPGRVVVVWH